VQRAPIRQRRRVKSIYVWAAWLFALVCLAGALLLPDYTSGWAWWLVSAACGLLALVDLFALIMGRAVLAIYRAGKPWTVGEPDDRRPNETPAD
jgi:hypothetical protein